MRDLERDRLDEDRHVEETTAVQEDERHGVDAARERFGGRDLPASFAGMLVALAALVLLAGLASAAIGTIAFQTGVEGNENELSLGALIAAGAVIFLAFLLGGWAAGRMARYNGALNGFMVAVWFVVLGVVLAIAGAIADNAYNLFDNLRVADATLPNWFSAEEMTTGAIISSLAFVALMVVGAVLGGLWGTRMHARADREIAAGQDPVVVERRVIEQDAR